MIANNPFVQQPFNLMRHRPFSLLVSFQKKDGSPVDLTGASIRMVVAQPKHKGGTVVATATTALVSATLGTARADIQGDEMTMAAGAYVTTITLVSAEGYESTVVEGEVKVEHNPDPSVPLDHDPVFPPLGLTVTMRDQHSVTVRVDHAPDSVLLDIVQQALDAASAAQIEAAKAAASAASASGASATAAALAAAASAAEAAALAAQAAADAAAALAATGGENASVYAAQASASAAAALASKNAAEVARAASEAAEVDAEAAAAAAAASADAAAASAAAAAGGGPGTAAGDAQATADAALAAANEADDTADAAQAAANTAQAAANAAQAAANAAQAELDQTQADMETTIQNFGKNMFVNQNEHTDAVHVHSIRVRTQAQYDAIGNANTISDCLYVIRG